MPRRVTSMDVAREAGVSRATVSMVLNGRARGQVSPQMQQHVFDTARRLNYQPNQAALALRTQRTSTIGIVTDEIATKPFAGRMLRGAIERAEQRGLDAMIFDTDKSDQRTRSIYRRLVSRQVEGVLYMTMGLTTAHYSEAMTPFPHVFTNCEPSEEGVVPAVVPDDEGGAFAAVTHLIECGHRRIAFLQGDEDTLAPKRRLAGMRRAFEEAGLVFTTERCLIRGWGIANGHHATIELMRSFPDTTAIFCVNDRVAVGAYLALASMGLRVPQDVSIVGYDDEPEVANLMVPPLTTVALPHRDMGEYSVDVLLDQLAGKTVRESLVRVMCPLIQRASVAPPRE